MTPAKLYPPDSHIYWNKQSPLHLILAHVTFSWSYLWFCWDHVFLVTPSSSVYDPRKTPHVSAFSCSGPKQNTKLSPSLTYKCYTILNCVVFKSSLFIYVTSVHLYFQSWNRYVMFTLSHSRSIVTINVYNICYTIYF